MFLLTNIVIATLDAYLRLSIATAFCFSLICFVIAVMYPTFPPEVTGCPLILLALHYVAQILIDTTRGFLFGFFAVPLFFWQHWTNTRENVGSSIVVNGYPSLP
jgi:hypothetical protein